MSDQDHPGLQRGLADLRHARGLLQRDIAQVMGVAQSRVGHIEVGGHGLTVGTVARYVRACGGELTLYAVFDGDPVQLL